jgi:hypothetical protein
MSEGRQGAGRSHHAEERLPEPSLLRSITRNREAGILRSLSEEEKLSK